MKVKCDNYTCKNNKDGLCILKEIELSCTSDGMECYQYDYEGE